MRYKNILVTGGCGFIGSSFVRLGLEKKEIAAIVNLDLLTYAGSLEHIPLEHPKHVFIKGDICNAELVYDICIKYRIEAIVHFAAESHVDRSLSSPRAFLDTNVYGTFTLLEQLRKLPHIHFHHISTDEVYGSLEEGFFTEESPYLPNSPYSATKAASDHLVRAWGHSFDLFTTLSHCTNNFGPYQHEEKFIPRMIKACLNEEPLPVYGTGKNIRDWLYVEDHAEAIWTILEKGKKQEVYDIGGECEKQNIQVIEEIIDQLTLFFGSNKEKLLSLISFVEDRKGHDFRYAIDCSKIRRELGWRPAHSFKQALYKTLCSYINNKQVKV